MRSPSVNPSAPRPGVPTVAILVAGIALVAGASATLRAAKNLEPPSHWLRKAHHLVVVAEPSGVAPDGAYRFRVVETVSGEAPETVTVTVDEATLASIDPTERYLLGYTKLFKSRRNGRYYEYPQGPQILDIPLVGPALTPESPNLLRLLEPIEPESAEDARERLDAVVAQLALPDPTARRWVLADLYLYPQLSDHLAQADVVAFRQAFEAAEGDARSREYVLRILARQSGRLEVEWLVGAARRVAVAHPAELDLGSHVSSLLLAALELLRDGGRREDAGLARVHLYSNNPSVARLAMEAYVELDPERAAAELPDMLWQDPVSSDAWQVGADFLRQRQTSASSEGAH